MRELNLKLRPGRPEDAAPCGVICYEGFKTIAEQHNFPPDIPSADIATGLMSSMLAQQDIYSVIAESGGRVLGSNFLWEKAIIAGVGPITVSPDVQNGKIGGALMADVMERAARQGHAGVRLVQAAYHNRSLSLYTKLGFDVREPLSIMNGPAIRLAVPGYAVRSAVAADIDACIALGLRLFGFGRGKEMQDAILQGTATVVEHGGRITGYATLIGFFGHAVGESNADLKALIGAADQFYGLGFLLPTRNGELFRWCLGNGLHVVQPMTLMSYGLYNAPSGAFLPSILF
jgi:GNAT superfamily N-acetyltransferase